MTEKKAVTALIFNAQNELLLIKRRDVAIWTLPGGGVEPHESSEEAALRESLEETGCNVHIIRKVANYTPINRLGTYTTTFVCSLRSGAPKTGTETAAIAFFPLDRLPTPLFHIHLEMLQDALKNDPETLELKLTSVTWFKFALYLLQHPIRTIRFLLSQAGIPFNQTSVEK